MAETFYPLQKISEIEQAKSMFWTGKRYLSFDEFAECIVRQVAKAYAIPAHLVIGPAPRPWPKKEKVRQ